MYYWVVNSDTYSNVHASVSGHFHCAGDTAALLLMITDNNYMYRPERDQVEAKTSKNWGDHGEQACLPWHQRVYHGSSMFTTAPACLPRHQRVYHDTRAFTTIPSCLPRHQSVYHDTRAFLPRHQRVYLKNIYCHSLSIQYNVICLQNVYKINFYFYKIVHQNTWAQL